MSETLTSSRGTTSATAATHPAEVEGKARGGSPMLILVVLALSTFAVTVMQSMVMPVMNDMAHTLNVSMSTITWVLTVSQLSAAVFTPLLGSLGDALGRRRVLLVVLGLVTLGSVAVAVSNSFVIVLVGRVLQGMGFAAMPLAIGIVRSIFPAARVPSSLAILSAITGIGAGAGLLIAGLLAKAGIGAQPMFWLAGGVTLLGLLGTLFFVKLPEKARSFSLDYWGLLTLSGGLVALLLGINRGPQWGWTSAPVLGLFAAAVVLLVLWGWVESKVKHPLVDLKMMRRPVVLGTNLTAFLTGAGMFGAFVLIIQFVQTPPLVGYGFGGDALAAGLTLLPMSAGTLLASFGVSMLIKRFGPKFPLVLGTVIATTTFGFLLIWHTEHWQFYIASGLLGLGLGMGMGSMPTLLNSAVSPEETSIANGINATLRSLGGSIGTTITTTVLAATTIAGTSVPALAAYTNAFWIAGAICVIAVIASVIVPYRHRAQKVAAGTGPVDPDDAPTEVLDGVRAAAVAAPATAELPGSAGRHALPDTPAVRGLVTGSAGAPVRGAVVTLTSTTGQQLGRAVTGHDGAYALPLATGGTYMLVVAAPGLTPSAAAVPVADGPRRHDVVLAGGSEVHGTVRHGEPPAPAVGAGLTMIDATGEVAAGTRTDGAGRFVLGGLAVGHYTLTATLAGHPPAAVGVAVAADRPTVVDLELPSRAEIHGTVTAAADGHTVAGAVATLVAPDGNLVGSATTDADGTFVFADLPEGTYTLTAAGYAPEVRDVRLESGATSEIRVALGGRAPRDLPAPNGSGQGRARADHREDGGATPRPSSRPTPVAGC